MCLALVPEKGLRPNGRRNIAVNDGTIAVVSAEMPVGADGEADVPAEAEEPGGGERRSGRGRGAGSGSRPGEHREQRRRATRPRHQLQQRRNNATTKGSQEVSTPV